jgi:hypothetical protein
MRVPSAPAQAASNGYRLAAWPGASFLVVLDSLAERWSCA